MSKPQIIQIVLGSNNLPLCKELYTRVFGFAGAGERVIYSARTAQVLGLGQECGATVLYLVGRQELLQLEFWMHSIPAQRPLPGDWRPSDIGFCRFGIAVTDFDATLRELDSLNCPTMTAPITSRGLRRVCFRDPTVGVPVEIFEEGDGLPGRRDRYHDLDPSIVYAAVSVSNLDEALAFFGKTVGLEHVEVDLHGPEHEALWGLPDTRRRTAVLDGGSVFLELVEYHQPSGRPRWTDEGLARQGFHTVGVGSRNPAETGKIFERVKSAGLDWTVSEPTSFVGGNHVIGDVAHHMKTLSVPVELERQFGYCPELKKRWWRPPTSS